MKRNKIFIFFILLFIETSVYAQITLWDNTAFVTMDSKTYNNRINKTQFEWNDYYNVVAVEGNVFSDETLRTYLFSYLDNTYWTLENSEIEDIYEEIQDFANGYIDDETIYCYFHDKQFCYIIFFTITLKKGQKIKVKQDATFIPIKIN